MDIKKIQLSNGESYSLLIGNDNLPMNYPTLFITHEYRNTSKTSNTSHKVVEHIKYLYEVCAFLNIDLEDRCKKGDFLTKAEIQLIVKWARKTIEFFRKATQKHQGSKKVIELKHRKKKAEDVRQKIVVETDENQSDTTYYKITNFAIYINWLEQYFFPTADEENKNSTYKKLIRYRPRRENKIGATYTDNGDYNPNYRSFTEIELNQIHALIDPDSPNNPWKSEGVRYRNQLIINILEDVGNRRGELAKIKLDDISQSPENGGWYIVIRQASDMDDTRKNKPEAKTLGRLVPIDDRLKLMIDEYILSYRSTVPGAENIPYLFITHNHKRRENNALSLSSINAICKKLSQILGFTITPHMFRHTWNDEGTRLRIKLVKEGKTTDSKFEKDRQRLMGWSENSKSAQRYTQRVSDEEAMKTGRALQETKRQRIEKSKEVLNDDLPF